MREKVSEFAGKIAAKGADTVAMIFYAGHGLQIDGENFLVPVDIDVKRESDIPMQAVRVNDILNTLTSVPSKMRFLLLDACRNNPFPELNKSVGRGLAIVDAKIGAPNTFLSFSTSPGAEAEDGSGANSPYTTALLEAAKAPNIPVEETFKRVRLAVNKATDGRQTPWDSSSLTEDFRFSGTPVAGPKLAAAKKTVEEWKRDLKGKPVEEANELIVGDGTDEAYEAFATLYASTPRGLQARDWLDRHRRMTAWKNAIIINTAAGYRAFIAQYPDSDLVPTARKLEERLRYRPNLVAANAALPVQNASLAPTCSCSTRRRRRRNRSRRRSMRRSRRSIPIRPSAPTASRRSACTRPRMKSWSSAARRRRITSRRPARRSASVSASVAAAMVADAMAAEAAACWRRQLWRRWQLRHPAARLLIKRDADPPLVAPHGAAAADEAVALDRQHE